MAEPKKEYAAVDIFKMFCAILVMLIHTKPFDSVFFIDAPLGLITRFAVPFFFTTSGYFFNKKLTQTPEDSNKLFKSYLFRLLRFYLIWFIIFRLEYYILSGQKKSVLYYIKQFFFTNDGSPLWFVCALIWAVVLVFFLSKILNIKYVFMTGMICFLTGYAFSTLLGVTENCAIYRLISPFTDFIGIQGGLFFAFPYVAMGALLSTANIKKRYLIDSMMVLLFLALLGVESLVAVICLKAPYTYLWISAVPMTWFVTRLMISVELENRKIYYYVRKTSTLFYVLHVVIYKMFSCYIENSGISDRYNMKLTIMTFVFTAAVCLSMVFISRKKAFSWLKYVM